MAQNRPQLNEDHGSAQVLRFRPRQRLEQKLAAGWPIEPDIGDNEPFDDLAEYEQDRPDDEIVDYRRRMLMNVMAALVVTLLVGAGVWIADTITAMERAEDCLMQGRKNCAPIEVAPLLPAPKK